MNSHPHARTIWNRLMKEFGNEKGVAGLMGNLRAESGLYPDRVQGDIPYSDFSKQYTAEVDNGTITREVFAHNGPNGGGYGLAQWTFYTRKYALYDMWKSGGYSSIGSVELGCDFLIHELKNSYSGLYDMIKNAVSIRTVSDYILHDFENPADQSTSVEELRESLGKEVYEAFSGSSETPDNPDEPNPTPSKVRKLSKLLLYAVASDIY